VEVRSEGPGQLPTTTGPWGVLMSIKGQTVVIIGGSAGIGLELARQVSPLGPELVIVGRDPAKLEAVREQCDGAVRTLTMDAHKEGEAERLFEKLGSVDHVVSMVGDSMSGGFLETSPDTMRHVLHSKFWSNWRIGAAAAPKFRQGGSITFTSGTGGRPHHISATYVANLGVTALVQGLAVELAPRVRVNAVAPTFMGTGTSFWRDVPHDDLEAAGAGFVADVPLTRMATVHEVASTYTHLIENQFITGQVIQVDGGVMLVK
jgi:NAD(P)-dependent dehydrogenase (short-subunit alcohol dehydrogenase family)